MDLLLVILLVAVLDAVGALLVVVGQATDSFHTEQLAVIGTGRTRFRKLNVPLRAIETMRTAQGVPELPEGSDGDVAPDDADEDDAE